MAEMLLSEERIMNLDNILKSFPKEELHNGIRMVRAYQAEIECELPKNPSKEQQAYLKKINEGVELMRELSDFYDQLSSDVEREKTFYAMLDI